ncbi:Serine/threonine-protein kinase AFC3 [Apostasia shenzhenica]|uniref:Serine/threonine-protein kinase PRP4 homolog n=1 Tax=Apostasia shenzhenica TaxID=1088818 RepID=A0A2I0BAQ6_9ASPA|nr:Serine/threonine-protein kinase AFC3 [Apostasia shenzhenica]
MGSENLSSPNSSRSKHRRSSDDVADDEPKRKRHHRHHHHRRRHRHHSKHGRCGEEEEGETVFGEERFESAPLVTPPVDDELEEGEICEEDEGGGDDRRRGAWLASKVDSDIESGEIAMETVPSLLHEEPSQEEDSIPEHSMEHLNATNNVEILKNYCVKTGDFVFEMNEDIPNGVHGYGSLAGDEARQMSKSVKASIPEKHINATLNDLRIRERSRSPVSIGNLCSLKHSDKDNLKSIASDHTSEKVNLMDKLEEDHKTGSVCKNKSVSPANARGKHRELLALSPSCKHLGDIYNGDQSTSDELSFVRLYEQDDKLPLEDSIPANRSQRHIRARDSSDHELSGRYDLLDRHIIRIRGLEKEVRKEREDSVHSRFDGCDDRHSSRDRGRDGVDRRHGDQDRGKEVDRRSNDHRDSDHLLADRYGDIKKRRSYSRYDGREDRHGSRDRERDRDRDREKCSRREREREKERDSSRERFTERGREKEKDSNRERFRERERIRDGISGREREKNSAYWDQDQIRDRKTHSHKDKGQVDHLDRGRSYDHERPRDSRYSRYDDPERSKDRTKSVFSKDAMSDRHKEDIENFLREQDEEDYQGRIEQQLAEQDDDIDKIKEESRKRTQAILQKYKKQQMQQHDHPVPKAEEEVASVEKESNDNGAQIKHKTNYGPSETGHDELVDHLFPSSADFVDPTFTLGKSPVQNGFAVSERSTNAGLGEGSPKSERSADMFCDDIFGESPAGVRKLGKDDGLRVDRSGLHDNWDDAEGYYCYRLGEVLDGRYEVIAAHGKGVFSTVVRAKDLKAGKGDPEEVAIKIIRSNDTMYKAGMEELVILKKLAGADPEDKRHCKFGRNIGLRLTAVRAYAKQLFIALKHLRNCGVLHCDIKPDNMLVNEAKNVLKLCDFGNAMFAGKNEITPYLVSRFYRAPEIILGLPYDHPLDMWSVGCCLFELYTGKVLFPGPSNNDMLRLHMELKGPFPKKMLRKGAFIDHHFDPDMNFHATEEDPVTKKAVKRLILSIKPKDIGSLVSGSPGEDLRLLANFKDLLERIFVLDPEKRMTVSQALSHPFITGK